MNQLAAKTEKLYFIDLFAGAGGLSEGFIQAGFYPIAHVEMNEFAAKTLVTRSAYYYLRQAGKLSKYYDYMGGRISREALLEQIPKSVQNTVLCETMSDESLPAICKRIDGIMKIRGINKVDVIIGGPPCQAYSLVGRAQSKHMEVPMSQDPRNKLYILYGRMLKKYKPRMFVFENVMGIESANGGATWKNLKKYLRRVGYEIECQEQNAKSFGVLQNRRRMIIIGWLKDSGLSYPEFTVAETNAVVSDLLCDLPSLTPGKGASSYSNVPASSYVLEHSISALRSERNALHAAIRQKQNRMKEINQLRQAIRDYRRTKDVYAQYKASGWSPKFYNEHRTEIEDHKKAQAVYSSVEGKMPTLKELSTEYEALKSEKEADDAALEGLKPKLTTLNHIKYNFDVLERDYLPEEKDLRREENPER